MNKIYLLIFLLNSLLLSSQTTYNIEDPEELSELVLAAGDVVILKNNTYSSDERILFTGIGTADNPITFRSETPGGVIFDNGLQLDIAGEYLIVDGFYWNGGYGASNFIQFRKGTTYAQNCTIQNCAINGLSVSPDDIEAGTSVKHRWIVLYGNYNKVINCSFMNKSNAGALILVELEYNALSDRCAEVGHAILNNYFYNYEKIDTELSNSGDSETIRIGTSEFQEVNCATTVSNNYFVSADGENEIITNKSANNVYNNNTFRRCRGSLVLRHGSNATVDGNYFLGENIDGTGGIRIVDSDHTITNNYIQDCITVADQAKWNNGITFMGGGANVANICDISDAVNYVDPSNGYQRSENIKVSNNTIVNTYAPLFYNGDKGKNDVTGIISDNIIYFDAESNNITNVITGDDTDSYSSFGTTLSYTGNVYNVANLGITSAEALNGFAETTLSSSENGEVFSIIGAVEKGADLGMYEPANDSMVGNGIGCEFVEPGEPIDTDTLYTSNVPNFEVAGGDKSVSVFANVTWTAVSNNDWITISSNSGDGEAMLTVSVTENVLFESRTGTVTFSQVGGDLGHVLNVTQDALDVRSDYILINDNTSADNVSVEFVFDEEVDPDKNKNNIAVNSLDKDFDTQWSGEGYGGEIIYDLGGVFDLALVDFASTSGKTYEFQVWVSTLGTLSTDFVNAFPQEGNEDGNLTSNSTGEFKPFVLPTVIENVKYVKIIGYGQPSRPSPWNTITEIEFYRTNEALSINEFTSAEALGLKLFPNPVTDILNIERVSLEFDSVKVYSVLGDEVLALQLNSINSLAQLDLSVLSAGFYFVEITDGKQKAISRIIVAE